MLFRPPKPTSMTLNLAPMVDVMMCLIIFFLLGSSLVKEETRPVQLPYAQAAANLDRSTLGARVVVNVRPSASGSGAEYVVAGWDGRQIVEHTYTAEQLDAYLRAKGAAAADDRVELRCVVRADREVSFRDVEAVLRGCGSAKIARVVFSANAGTDPGVP